MLASFVMAAGIASFALAPGADTTLAVSRGASLNVANYAGEVFIEAWERSSVRIQADHSEEDKVVVHPSNGNGSLTVKAYSKDEGDRSADLRLIVPVWMNVTVSGIHTDVIVTGTRGQVRAETVHGDVIVRGGRNRIILNTVNQDICVSDAIGTVRAETVNGDAFVWRAESDSVDISTVNGTIVYDGTMKFDGLYRFTSHNGDIEVAMPRAAGATVAVSTFAGEFESNFPVTLSGINTAKRFQFCVGDCSARVELESFQGTIQIYKAGPTPSARVQKIDQIVERIISKRLSRSERLEDKLERAQRVAEKVLNRSKKRYERDEVEDCRDQKDVKSGD
jgi:hypothetical protein